MTTYQSLAATAWALCCEAGAEYGQVGYDACLAWCERLAQDGKPHTHSVDGLVKLWRTHAGQELYTTSEYGKRETAPIAPSRRAMYTELARQAWFYAALRPVFNDLKVRANGLARSSRRARLRHNLAPMYYSLANDAKRLLLSFPDTVPGDVQTRRQTILDMAQVREQDRRERRAQREQHAALYNSQPERTGTWRARTSVPSGRTEDIKRLMR